MTVRILASARTQSRRNVEPYRLVLLGRRWYLVAFDVVCDDWRSVRIDRLPDPASTGTRCIPRERPGGDAAEFLRRGSRACRRSSWSKPSCTSKRQPSVHGSAPRPLLRNWKTPVVSYGSPQTQPIGSSWRLAPRVQNSKSCALGSSLISYATGATVSGVRVAK